MRATLVRKLSTSKDPLFGSSMDDYYTGTDAVAAAIFMALRFYQGEWWEDQQIGLPLFQNILGGPGTTEQKNGIDMLIQEAILGVPNVQGISNFTSSVNRGTRTYTFNATVQTTYGDVGLKEVQLGP